MPERHCLLAGIKVPVVGQGTWCMGNDAQREARALRTGIDLGLTLIDTAEMYADGRAELVVADAIRGCRDAVVLVSKVLPQNATADGTVRSCEMSLKRLGVSYLDLYLLHWRREIPLEETVRGFDRLMQSGKIRSWGVSNFNVSDLDDLPTGSAPAADQILYNLVRRGPEADLLPSCAARQITVMAYSPIEKGRLLDHPALMKVAIERGVTPAQVALAWAVRNGNTVAIPKASTVEHVRDNASARDLVLTDVEIAALDHAFPAPPGPVPLETLS